MTTETEMIEDYLWRQQFRTIPAMPKEVADILRANFKSLRELDIAQPFIDTVLPKTLSFVKRAEIAKLNIDMEKEFTQKVVQTVGEYTIKRSTYELHIEAPMQFDIVDPNGKVIANFHAYFMPSESGKLELHINLIQGKKNCESELRELTMRLGESWRTFIVKLLKRVSNDYKIELIGQLPIKFGDRSTPEEYLRQLRQYMQAYLQGGLSSNNIRNDRVNANFKEWIRNNLRIKQERQEGLRPQQKQRVKLDHKPGIRRPKA